MHRFGTVWIAATLAGTLGLGFTATPAQTQQQPASLKIGWAISKTGPYVGGATITLLNPYKLWVRDVNAAGGIMLGGRKVPVEVVEYDDRSNSDEMIKALERLINQDKVDFLFPPWGTAFSLASAPIFARAGYPQVLVTATTDRAPEFAKRWPNSFWLLGTATEMADSAVEAFSKLRSEGKIGNTVALIGVADQFGIELSTAAREAFKKANFNVVYDKSYPLGTQDMQPILTEAMRSNADVFMAASYPPDTFAIIDQAKVLNYNPKIFFTAVGTAFPAVKQRFGANAEGIMGTGGWNADSPDAQGLPEAPPGDARLRARSLGEPRHLFQPADAAAGDRAGRQGRPRGGDQGALDRHLRYRLRQGEAGRQPLPRCVPDRPMARRRILRHRAGTARRCAGADLPQAGMEAMS